MLMKTCFSLRQSFVYLLAVCFCTAAALSSALAQSTPTEGQAAQPVEQARALIDARKPDEAIQLLTNARTAGSDAEVGYLLGVAYHLKGDYPHAVENLSIAVKKLSSKDEKYLRAIQVLGTSYYLLGQFNAAISYLSETSQLLPDSAEIMYALGTCYVQTRNVAKSREVFAHMFKVPESSAAAYLINAQMLVRQQFEELAEQELKQALERDPKLPQVNFLLGEMAIFHADIDRGINYLQKEIELNPGFAMAYYWLGEAYSRQLKWGQAIAPLQKSIWLNPYFSGPYIVLGKAYMKRGDLQNAELMLRRSTQMDPNNFSAHHLLAQVLQRANRVEEAKREFDTAEKLRTITDKEP